MVKNKLKAIALDKRIWILLIAIVIAFAMINPNPWREGLVIKAVEKDSAASMAGLKSGELLLAVDNKPVKTLADYESLTKDLRVNDTILIETENFFRKLTILPVTQTNVIGNETIVEIIGVQDIGLDVAKAPKSNIRTGLDLQGGTRVLLQPEVKLESSELELLIQNMNRRLNLFGLSDVTVRDASDFSGQQFVMVEIAGVNEQEIKDLISRQGKFEAKVGNVSVFKGSDVIDVCRGAECSGIDYRAGGCQPSGPGEFYCPFYFSISLTKEAAQRQADATKDLTVIDGYLSEKLFLYLDDQLVDELNIGESLKGVPTLGVQISGSGTGTTQNTASRDATQNMKQLQTILITGSLPVKLQIARIDAVSPSLGDEFGRNAMLTGLVAIVAVSALLFIVYRKLIVAIPMLAISLIEIFLLIGVAAMIKWNIDLAAIAGIIAAVGTGVNDQIIIADETLKGEYRRLKSWKEKVKSAFSVIFGAYFTMLFAMIPLFLVGAGMLRGFAVTTIIGMTVGVLITRPAYAKIIEILMED